MKKFKLLKSTDTTHVIEMSNGYSIELPRVTEIIKGGGLSDFSRVDKDVLERNGNFGKAVHAVCQYYDENRLENFDYNPDIEPYVEGWRMFRQKEKWARKKPRLIEQLVYSRIWGFAGIPDRVWIPNLVDIKTAETVTKNLIKEWEAQSAAYQKALKECLNITIKNRFVVWLFKGGYKPIPLTRTDSWTAFTNLMGVYRWKSS